MKVRYIILSIVAILIIGIGFRVVPVVAKARGNLHQALHWMVYGYDRVWYHNRTYLGPSNELTLEQIKSGFEKETKLIPTGEKVIGLPVYDTPNSIEAQKQGETSTVLILKKHNGSFIEYSLSGGP